MTEHLVVVDVGTTAVKAAAVGRDLRVLGVASSAVDTRREAEHVEQDPEQWWASAVEAVRGLPAVGEAVGLAVTGQMQDLVPVRSGSPVGPAILYSDHRAARQHGVLVDRIGEDRWFDITANEQDASNLAAKLTWLLTHEPGRLEEAEHVLLGAHSFLAYRACGAVVCDPTTASTTGLYASAQQGWAGEVLAAIGPMTAELPALHSPLEPCGVLDPSAATDLGLPHGIPVIHSAGDAGTTTVGAGIEADGGRYAYLGTSGWLATTTADTVTPRRALFTLEHPFPGHRIQIGPMLSVGACIDWVRDQLLHLEDHEAVERLVAGSTAPSTLLFLPYLAGERSPMRDPEARGVVIGLTPSSDAASLVRAVMEGVVLSLRSIETLMAEDGHEGPLVVAGGASRSDAWCQILADVFGAAVLRLDSIENVAVLGAARLSWSALGAGVTATEVGGSSTTFEPDGRQEPIYARLRQLQRRAYEDLRSVVHGLHEVAGEGEA